MISKLVIVGLIVVWAVVLLPDLRSFISRNRRGDTIRSFNTQLSSLGRSAPVGRGDNVIDLRSRTAAHKPAGFAMSTSRSTANTPRSAVQAVPSSGRPVSGAVRKRRQDVLVALGAAALLTLLATVSFGGVFLYLHLLADVLFAAYLVALHRVGASRTSTRATGLQIGTPGASLGNLAPLGMTPVRADTLEPRRIAN